MVLRLQQGGNVSQRLGGCGLTQALDTELEIKTILYRCPFGCLQEKDYLALFLEVRLVREAAHVLMSGKIRRHC